MILTHLHADHVGWNTRLVDGDWVPTFPRARYLTSRAERVFWAAYEMEEAREQMFRDSVLPVEEAGLLDLIDVPAEGLTVAPGLRLLPTPGHTPGHVAVELTGNGGTAVITGDCVHHPVQLAHPAIGACVDIDPHRSESSRRALLDSLAGTDTLVLGTHFAPPTAGRVITHDGAYRLSPSRPTHTDSRRPLPPRVLGRSNEELISNEAPTMLRSRRPPRRPVTTRRGAPAGSRCRRILRR